MIFLTRLILLFTLSFFPMCLMAQDEDLKLEAPLFDDLKHFHHPIQTTRPLTQSFFNQGMIFFYGFEWGESIRSFKEAVRLDPQCAMCYFGLALALGYKANAPMNGHEYTDAKKAIETALQLAKEPHEKAYMQTLALRFAHPSIKTLAAGPFICHLNGGEQASPLDLKNYTLGWEKVMADYPNDEDARALYVYAMFDLIDWKFWSKGTINPHTATIINILHSILIKNPLHIGANHYYIHVIEQSPHPKLGLQSAKRLETLVPISEHLMHMPSHIYFLLGDYHRAVEINLAAINAYKEYSELVEEQGFKPEITYLYLHNFDFLRIAASREGNQELSISAAQDLIKNLPFQWIQNDPSLQWFIPIPYYVYARFGLWHEIIQESIPPARFQYALGMWHYASGIALAYTGHINPAINEAKHLNDIIKKGPTDAVLGKVGLKMLMIAYEMLNAVIGSIQENEKTTITHLKKALSLQNSMDYSEPPNWYFPIEEALGYAYLRWNHFKEAKEMFEEDLRKNPKNGWALFGLTKALKLLKDNTAAKQVEKEFHEAWQYADIEEPFVLF